ncbi:hypothetical protein REPUB_Repub10bG0038000 [Reevesia pubescens]
MTTLQRSSVSFRRQGSSGRIWNDRHIIDQKTGFPNAAASAIDGIRHDQENHQGNIIRSPEEYFCPKQEEIHHPQSTNFESHPKPKETNASPRKGQRCGISVLFGRCMGPTA